MPAIIIQIKCVGMKKILFFAAIFLSFAAIALQGKITSVIVPEKLVTKTVEFSMFLANNYTAPIFKKSSAKIVLTVYKLKGNSQEILWQIVVDKGNLKNYPSYEKSLFRKVSIYNIHEQSESVVASYKVIYDTRGSEFSYAKTSFIKSAITDTLLIAI
jgi:hypothetical protein